MSGTVSVATRPGGLPAPETQAEHSKPELRRFALLAVQLGLFVIAFRFIDLGNAAIFKLTCLIVIGFCISYWLPFRLKEPFFILFSLAGAYVLLDPVSATLLIAAGLVMFGILRSALDYRWRVAAMIGLAAIFVYVRATHGLKIPAAFWPAFGTVFMFRMIIYIYDLKHSSQPAQFNEYLSYFFLLPGYIFVLFPIVDFHTFRKSYFKRDIHTVAQTGVWWMFRGTTHLLAFQYLVRYGLLHTVGPGKGLLAARIVLAYFAYWPVSGSHHLIVGMLRLFGYDLPEPHRRYLLAHSVLDFWRRINVYRREFYIKIFYLPLYFKIRRGGELRAQLISTAVVFVATWATHVAQYFWNGTPLFSFGEAFFWGAFGAFAMVNVWIEYTHKKRRPETDWASRIRKVAQIAAVFVFVASLRYSREIDWAKLGNRLVPGLNLKTAAPAGPAKE